MAHVSDFRNVLLRGSSGYWYGSPGGTFLLLLMSYLLLVITYYLIATSLYARKNRNIEMEDSSSDVDSTVYY